MHMFKKVMGMVLAIGILLTALSPGMLKAEAAEFILESSAISGQDFTGSDRFAALLDQVFAGDIDIFTDNAYTKEVSMPLGINMSKSTLYYVKSQTTGNPVSGWQCYIYANAVYNKLFREWVGHADAFAHSKVVIPGGSNKISYDLLRSAGVRCGAYLRTTGNSSGAYNGSVGHSMIILGYNKQTITFLEGNADGYGLIRVAIRTWDEFNSCQLSGRNRYISHMVQPTDAFYSAQFPECAHMYVDCGVCSSCGHVYNWEDTIDPWSQGIYRLTEKVIPRTGSPYSAAPAASVTLEKDQKIRTTGQYRNAFDQVWFSALDASGKTFFVNGASLKFVEYPELEVKCADFSPADGAKLEQKSHPVKGTVSANYPLKSISGYLDGSLYATWVASDETTNKVDLRQTDINQKLSFSKLSGGKHTVTLVVRSFAHGNAVTVHESSFYVISAEPCTHEHTSTVTRDATCTEDGIVTYTCLKCDDSYIRSITAHGHDYQNGSCVYCAEREPLSSLSGSILSAGKAEDRVNISLMQDGKDVYNAEASTDFYSISGIQPGTYVMSVTKNNCVPLNKELTVDQGDSVFDVKLCNPGDVNGDHRLNIGDISKLYAHVRGSVKLQDEYAQSCADYNADGTINIGDTVRLYSFLRKN